MAHRAMSECYSCGQETEPMPELDPAAVIVCSDCSIEHEEKGKSLPPVPLTRFINL